jgi:hypothetical protein
MKVLSERDINIHTARVLLGEARNRRGAPRSHCVILEWAGNARRRAMAATEQPEPDLFSARLASDVREIVAEMGE